MNEQKNVAVVQNAYATFQREDIEALLGLMTDDIDWQMFGPDELPMSGLRKGKREVARFFEQVSQSWNFEHFEPKHFVAQGDEVVALGIYSGTAKGSGRRFESEWAHAFTVREGKIKRFREYTDTANLIRAYSKSTAAV